MILVTISVSIRCQLLAVKRLSFEEDSRLYQPHQLGQSSLPKISTYPTNVTSVFSFPAPQYQHDTPSPVKDLLKIFVYDNLNKALGKDVENFLYNAFTNTSAGFANSDWKSELALIELFRSFPGRTWNASEADIFIVPYAHAGHCLMTPGWQNGCGHVLPRMIKLLFSSLVHIKLYRDRHLFIRVQGRFLAHKKIDRQSLAITTGPRRADLSTELVVFQFNDAPRFQPSSILSRDEIWWTRHRKYAFSFFFGANNPNIKLMIGGRRFRTYFRQDMEQHYGSSTNTTIAGMPYQLHVFSTTAATADHGVNSEKLANAFDSYENSIFCPILAGDTSWQRRFFDAILCGCLPLVISWDTPKHLGGKSWFLPTSGNSHAITFSVQQTYPFAKGLFNGEKEVEIDYESFVVECPGNPANESDVSSIRQTIEDLLLHRPNEIRERQLAMQKIALSFTFGMGEDAHRYEDGFARMVRALRFTTDNHLASHQV